MGTKIPEPRSRWKLRAAEARAVLFVHAVEQADPRGDLVSAEDRRGATKKALEEHGKAAGDRPERWLGPRALFLLDRLRKTRPELCRVHDVRELPRSWAVLVPVVAFLAGLGTNALGSERTINILAPPLLGLLLWNLGVYAALLVRAFLPAKDPEASPWWSRWSPLARRSRAPSRDAAPADPERQAASDFAVAWLPTVAPLVTARLSRLLHLASMAAVLGVVAGMYLRGLALEYRAAWESTFLGPATVDAFLGAVFGPAGAILGIELPSAAELAAPATGPAAPWIHMWATTALLGVGLPRLLLAGRQTLRLSKLSRGLPVELPDGYVRRLSAAVDTREENVQMVFYSYRPAESALAHLRNLLLDLVGARARFRGVVQVEYGDDPPPADEAGLRVVVFGATQTPELEVHGEWLAALRRERVDGQSLLVVVDEGPFKKRLQDDSGRRLESRERAWDRVLGHADLPGVFLELDPERSVDAQLEILARGVWPARSAK